MALINLFTGQQLRCKCTEQTYRQGRGKEGEGEMNGESILGT